LDQAGTFKYTTGQPLALTNQPFSEVTFPCPTTSPTPFLLKSNQDVNINAIVDNQASNGNVIVDAAGSFTVNTSLATPKGIKLNGNVYLRDGIYDSTGTAGSIGKFLTSNGFGKVIWATPSGGGGGSDWSTFPATQNVDVKNFKLLNSNSPGNSFLKIEDAGEIYFGNSNFGRTMGILGVDGEPTLYHENAQLKIDANGTFLYQCTQPGANTSQAYSEVTFPCPNSTPTPFLLKSNQDIQINAIVDNQANNGNVIVNAAGNFTVNTTLASPKGIKLNGNVYLNHGIYDSTGTAGSIGKFLTSNGFNKVLWATPPSGGGGSDWSTFPATQNVDMKEFKLLNSNSGTFLKIQDDGPIYMGNSNINQTMGILGNAGEPMLTHPKSTLKIDTNGTFLYQSAQAANGSTEAYSEVFFPCAGTPTPCDLGIYTNQNIIIEGTVDGQGNNGIIKIKTPNAAGKGLFVEANTTLHRGLYDSEGTRGSVGKFLTSNANNDVVWATIPNASGSAWSTFPATQNVDIKDKRLFNSNTVANAGYLKIDDNGSIFMADERVGGNPSLGVGITNQTVQMLSRESNLQLDSSGTFKFITGVPLNSTNQPSSEVLFPCPTTTPTPFLLKSNQNIEITAVQDNLNNNGNVIVNSTSGSFTVNTSLQSTKGMKIYGNMYLNNGIYDSTGTVGSTGKFLTSDALNKVIWSDLPTNNGQPRVQVNTIQQSTGNTGVITCNTSVNMSGTLYWLAGVAFATPFQDNNYQVVVTQQRQLNIPYSNPTIQPFIDDLSKTQYGFTVYGDQNAKLNWIAVGY